MSLIRDTDIRVPPPQPQHANRRTYPMMLSNPMLSKEFVLQAQPVDAGPDQSRDATSIAEMAQGRCKEGTCHSRWGSEQSHRLLELTETAPRRPGGG